MEINLFSELIYTSRIIIHLNIKHCIRLTKLLVNTQSNVNIHTKIKFVDKMNYES